MGFWTAVVIIVAIATGGEVYRANIKSGGGKSEEYFNNLSRKLARLEDRIANLEMIVLEKEKARQYDKL